MSGVAARPVRHEGGRSSNSRRRCDVCVRNATRPWLTCSERVTACPSFADSSSKWTRRSRRFERRESSPIEPQRALSQPLGSPEG